MYSAYITTLKELHKHPNADRLQCSTVFGNNVIVDLSYVKGQRVIYFPVDGQLSEEFATENNLVKKYIPVTELDDSHIAGKTIINKDGVDCINVGGYMDADKRNITAIKLRGEKSDGLVLPIETLSKYVDIATLRDGDQITVIDGHEICRKYIPKRKKNHTNSSNKHINKKELKEEVSYPFFTPHIDTQQLAYNMNAFHEGDTIYLTQKLHGSSFRVSNALEVTTRKRPHWIKKIFNIGDKVTKKYGIISGTRRMILRNYDGGYYGSNLFRKKYNDMFVDKLPKGFTVYGEIVGWINETTPIMPRCSNSKVKDKEFSRMYGKETVFTYGCDPGENDCYIYRITITNDDGVVVELPTEDVIIWCEKLGVKYVPLLEKFIYTTWDDLNKRCEKYLDIPEPLSNGKHITEGVCVRIDNREIFSCYKTKSFYFKVLEGLIKDIADAPDIEEAEELLDGEI